MNFEVYFNAINSLIEFKLKKIRPFNAILLLTYKCNENCRFCYNKIEEKELSTLEWKKVIKEIGKLGVVFCSISGGEPLLRNDVIELGEYIKKNKMISALNTNGTLINEANAEQILKSFERIAISLDGFKKTHNLIRRRKYAFQETWKGIKILKKIKEKKGLSAEVGVYFVINRLNYKELLPILHFLMKKRVVDFINIQPVNFVKELYPPPSEIRGIISEVKKIKEKYPSFIKDSFEFLDLIPRFFEGERFPCHAGELYFILEPNGNVLPCSYFFEPLGNVRKESLSRILSSKKAKVFKELIRSKCDGCLFKCTIEVSQFFSTPLPLFLKKMPLSIKVDHFG
jgi:MoaA/NifB/PqqE/SkfB family radical SAM enzyme